MADGPRRRCFLTIPCGTHVNLGVHSNGRDCSSAAVRPHRGRAWCRTVEGRWAVRSPWRIDIARDKEDGELFDVQVPPRRPAELSVLHLEPAPGGILLLMSLRWRLGDGTSSCAGHDERHWFVAAVPERIGPPSTVATAMEALKPGAEIEPLLQSRLQGPAQGPQPAEERKPFSRQGEWFFVRGTGTGRR